jgi:hypothetical protein
MLPSRLFLLLALLVAAAYAEKPWFCHELVGVCLGQPTPAQQQQQDVPSACKPTRMCPCAAPQDCPEFTLIKNHTDIGVEHRRYDAGECVAAPQQQQRHQPQQRASLDALTNSVPCC